MELHSLKGNILKIKKFASRSRILHNSFEIGILIKGVDGVLEICGGLLLILFNPVRLNKIIVLLTQHELSEDPSDVIANFILKMSRGFSVGTQHFGIFYLLSHGIIKIVLVILLWRKKVWAYPLTVAFLVVFIGIQIHRYIYSHSIFLIILSAFDLFIILLTMNEYGRIKTNLSKEST